MTSLYALVRDDGAVERLQDFGAPPPELAPEKRLRWMPVVDEAPDLAAGEIAAPPTITVEAGVVRRRWTAALPPPPVAISPLQMRLALRSAGLIDAAQAAIEQRDAAERDAWEYATVVRRDSELVALIAAELGIDDAALDELFRAAAAIRL